MRWSTLSENEINPKRSPCRSAATQKRSAVEIARSKCVMFILRLPVAKLSGSGRALRRDVSSPIYFLGTLELKHFCNRGSPFGGRFPVNLVEAVASLVVSRNFSNSLPLPICGWVWFFRAAVQEVCDIFFFQEQVRIDADFASNRPMASVNPQTERGMPIKVETLYQEGSA